MPADAPACLLMRSAKDRAVPKKRRAKQSLLATLLGFSFRFSGYKAAF